MNEVEKMYRNAHVYPRVYGDITKETFENKVFNIADMCNEAFTAEKQLELIKKLGNINIDIDIDNGYYMSSEILEVEAHCDTFEETLAEFVNNLWQDLTEEERKQIRNILE